MITANSFYVALSVAVERNLSEEAVNILRSFALAANSLAVWGQELTPQERADLRRFAQDANGDADDIINENEKRQEIDGKEEAS